MFNYHNPVQHFWDEFFHYTVMILLTALCVLGILSYAVDLSAANGPVPNLIGIGCDQSGGDLWAMEESDFPTDCDKIEKYKELR